MLLMDGTRHDPTYAVLPGSPLQGQKGYRGLGVIEKKVETTRIYWGYMGIMDNRMRVLFRV